MKQQLKKKRSRQILKQVLQEDHCLFVDLYSGAGGASSGVLWTLKELGLYHLLEKKSPFVQAIAVNHDPLAIQSHSANHPTVEHWDCDIEKLDPREALRDKTTGQIRKITILWQSSPCQDWSNAGGGPVKTPHKRATPEYMTQWVKMGQPEVILEENVFEITTRWDGWEDHVQELKDMGYNVEWKKLNAADYGTPQARNRLILIAVKGDRPIAWPKKTHSDPKKPTPGTKPWNGADTILNLDLPIQSIFGRTLKDGTPNPHSPKTRARISRHIRDQGKFWNILGDAVDAYTGPVPLVDALNAVPQEQWPSWVVPCDGHIHVYPADAFVQHHYGTGVCKSTEDPLGTVTAGGNHFSVCKPFVVGQQGGNVPKSTDEPLPTEATAGFIRLGQVRCTVDVAFGSDKGEWSRTKSLDKPLQGAITNSGRFALAEARCIFPSRGPKGGLYSNQPKGIEKPMPVVLAQKRTARVLNHGIYASPGVVLAHHGEREGQKPRIHPVDQAMPTIPASRGFEVAFAFVYTYNGNANARDIGEPNTTVSTKERHAYVAVGLNDLYLDVGMRMLTIQELARGQDFPDDYILLGTDTDRMRLIGNAVPVKLAAAVTKAVMLMEGIVSPRIWDFQANESTDSSTE